MNASERQSHFERLDRGIKRCLKCPLHESRTHAVPGEGPVPSTVMFVGEAPGKKEDQQGRPFVGASGRRLNHLLEKHGFSRDSVYITSCVKCRPPKNRNPHVGELRVCKENWLLPQIELLEPKLIVLLGQIAVKNLLETKDSLRSLRGDAITHDGQRYLVTYHPAAALRAANLAESMDEDFARIAKLAARLRG
jgi:uracil-DNA glycosylase